MTQFADYELIEPLGSGTSGRCFLATPPVQSGLDVDRVALKILSAGTTDETALSIAGELRLIASLGCDRLSPILDAGRVEGTIFYVTPYAPLGSVAAPTTVPTRRQVLGAFADAARAAHALHEAGIVHRAIKPANVLLVEQGGRLGDAGLAHLLAPGQTLAGFGTSAAIEFVEPATLLGQPAGRASDIWSLATSLHRALTASSVFGSLPTDGVLGALRHMLETPPALADDLSDGEASLLAWCLGAERADRPATAAIVADRLDRLAEAA